MPLFVQPPAETAAERYARDVSQMQGDWQNATVASEGVEVGDLVYFGPDDDRSRMNRTFYERGGDRHFVYDENGEAVEELDANGRNEREYVDYATGDSAHAGAGVFPHYDELKENS